MAEVDNARIILYRYLQALSVKVSRSTVHRLLDTPLGDSMRGISDALDSLHINNAVYQLPKEYLDKLESPCIAITNDNDSSFCLVEKIEKAHVTITIPHGQHLRVSRQQFLQKWTGGILWGEVTEATIQEKNCWLKDTSAWVLQHKLPLAGILAVLLILFGTSNHYSAGMILYLFTLCAGVFVSSAILYKETINSRFLHRFCHIGKVIDCNEVLHSKGSQIIGVGLGELALIYFCTLVLFALVRPHDFFYISVICSIVALAFTIYSVIYQVFIIRKGCALCMLINLIIWINGIALFLLKGSLKAVFSIQTILSLIAIGSICLVGWLQIKTLLKVSKKKEQLDIRFASLLNPEAFQKLLSLQPQIEEMITQNIALHNQETGDNEVMIVTNPNCKNCAKIHRHVKEIASKAPVSLVLLTFPNDRQGEKIAQIIITVYHIDGWNKAMQLLEEWYETKRIKEVDEYSITTEVQDLWMKQQVYCRQQGINKTPSVIVNKRYIPEVYPVSNLRYVLT
ncbi:vitamin K epoxide reductase family protein [Bacteroides sp. UBA939]|uniref:vitamin K epoxide reductase family protein n=1 Tax=Bacteroides sp. UBA939 TaxID=1946092 RepID=UPI0025C59D47|nr:vitamin K epoxide reductase family protein [Bacteroides sp. UBA939]